MLKSQLPTTHAPALRLRDYEELVRELSLTRTPAEMLQSYRSRSQFVVKSARLVSLSRRGVPDGYARITRSSTWTESIDPWKQPERLPVVDSGLFWQLIRTGKPVKLDQLEVAADDPAFAYVEGMQSLLASPIYHDGQPLYMVIMMQPEPAAYTLDDLCTIVLTSNLLGRATSEMVLSEQLEQAYAALDREFSTVGEIQRQLLPKTLPKIPGIAIATHYETSARAGGDYYTALELEDGRLAVLIADVSGHGAAAAVVVAMIHSLLQMPAIVDRHLDVSPARALEYLNAELSQSVVGGQFVTVFAGILDPRTRSFRYSNAGHNPPRWLRHGVADPVPLLAESGLPLAILEDYEYSEKTVEFAMGDRLLLYTDGITETFNRHSEMFGTEGIDAALRCCSRTPDNLISSILTAVREFGGGAAPEDDRTLVAIAFD